MHPAEPGPKGDATRDQRGVLPIDPDLSPSDPAAPTVTRRRRRGPRRPRRAQPDVLAVIALGGVLGASARLGISSWLPVRTSQFPWATFWTNLSGSFLLGLLLVVLLERFPPTRLMRPFLATGILGAFTTMSTYEVEIALLVQDGRSATALMYALGSLGAGLVAAYTGIRAGRLGAAVHAEVR